MLNFQRHVMHRAVLVIAMLPAGEAVAGSAPDEITDVEAGEANLESNAPRSGLVVAISGGGGVTLGGDLGVGRGGALSLRMGHVATRKTIISFEITGTGALHKQSIDGPTVTDTNIGLFAGAQRYAGSSTWFRVAGGFTALTKNIGGDESTAGGIGALLGGGLDLARWGYLVLGLETFAMSSITSGTGFTMQLGFNLGLSHY